MKKGTAKAMRYIVAGSALTLCVIMTGCGCGQKKTDPASEQVLKISITPEPSPTLAPDTVDAAAVTSNGDISMVNLYLAENPSAVTNSTDTSAGDANTTDASNMQSQDQDQSEDTVLCAEMSVLRFPLRSIGSGDKRQIYKGSAC